MITTTGISVLLRVCINYENWNCNFCSAPAHCATFSHSHTNTGARCHKNTIETQYTVFLMKTPGCSRYTVSRIRENPHRLLIIHPVDIWHGILRSLPHRAIKREPTTTTALSLLVYPKQETRYQ